MKPRLYLDEDVSPTLARLLRHAGFDAISAHEVGAARLSDRQQLDRARSEGRAIFTYNFRDFDRIARDESERGHSHAGIIVSYRQHTANEIGTLAHAMASFLEHHSAEDLRDTYQALTPPSDE